MTQDRATPQGNDGEGTLHQKVVASSYYGLMGLHPSASVREIRQAYRELSKLYHPDTTSLSATTATAKFQQLNEAYATLSSPERRAIYDRKIGYSTVPVIQSSLPIGQAKASPRPAPSSSAYLDPTDRPLSPGEIFALFILGLTFVGCLVLAITIGITRGDAVFQPITAHINPPPQEVIVSEPTPLSGEPSVEMPATNVVPSPPTPEPAASTT